MYTFKLQNNPKLQSSNPMQTKHYANPSSCNALFRSTEQNLIEKGTCSPKFIPTLRRIGCRLGQKIVIRQFFWYRGGFRHVLWRRGHVDKNWLLRQVFFVLTGRIDEEETRVDGRALTSRRGGVVGRTVRRRVLLSEGVKSFAYDWTNRGNIRKRIWDNKFRILVLWHQCNQEVDVHQFLP